ncbi:YfcE family phosphodiesterase [Candidatus Woesearchaeota archaeon]|nr:YfcE family phosphodiesterase [Candidatus Woesearchaeota archaeon]
MKIAIISDIHDNRHNLFKAFGIMKKERCDELICLGDMGSGYIPKCFAELTIPVFGIWGNNDGEKFKTMQATCNTRFDMAEATYGDITRDSRRLFLTHYPDLIEPTAKSGLYDAVFYGHTHLFKEEQVGNTLVVNPGELAAARTGKATFVIYNTSTNTIEKKEIHDALSMRTEYIEQVKKN